MSNPVYYVHKYTLCDINVDGQIFVYADDTCLLFSDTNWKSLRQKTVLKLNKVKTFFKY